MSALGKPDTMKSLFFLALTLLITVFSQQALAAPSLLSVSFSPRIMPANSASSVIVKVSEACPLGGCTVRLYSNNTLLPVPSYIVIPEGALSASAAVRAGNNTSGMDVQVTVQSTMAGISKYSYP